MGESPMSRLIASPAPALSDCLFSTNVIYLRIRFITGAHTKTTPELTVVTRLCDTDVKVREKADGGGGSPP